MVSKRDLASSGSNDERKSPADSGSEPTTGPPRKKLQSLRAPVAGGKTRASAPQPTMDDDDDDDEYTDSEDNGEDGIEESNRPGQVSDEDDLDIPSSPNKLPLDLPDPSNWHCVRTLGRGGQGIVSLWIKHDGSGNIVDRVALKETYPPRNSKLYWSRRQPLLPREVEIHRQLSRSDQSNCIVGFRKFAYCRNQKPNFFRIYMAWCPFGDLAALRMRYQGLDEEWSGNFSSIPEPMLWLIFEQLASAACLMERGTVDPSAPNHDDWSDGAIVHRDIKPLNIFLSESAAEDPQDLPTILLGDFGSSVQSKSKDFANPADLVGSGSVGYRPPEHLEYLDHYSDEVWDLDSYTNVYAIGLVMAELLTLTAAPQPEGHNFIDVPPNDQPLDWRSWTENDIPYSDSLTALVDECLYDRPESRIECRALLAKIKSEVDGPQEYSGQSMRLLQKSLLPDEIRLNRDLYSKFAIAVR